MDLDCDLYIRPERRVMASVLMATGVTAVGVTAAGTRIMVVAIALILDILVNAMKIL